ncbi:MAG: class I SAM-dependent methyltransferase [Eubacteriales bacterium]
MNQIARIKLSPRLQMVANMVRTGAVVADIGTDHAYIPVYLLQNGICPSAIAADLRERPLANARATVIANDLSEKITLRLSDGLDKIGADEVQDIILAGMGGTLITELLGRTAWLRDNTKRLIIQPMTHAEDARVLLCKQGFKILFEQACFEEHRCYVAMCAQFEKNVSKPVSPAYYYLGELPANGNQAAREHIKRQRQRLKKRLDGITKSGQNPEEAKSLIKIMQEISEVSYHDE